jgi:hypothetical protein
MPPNLSKIMQKNIALVSTILYINDMLCLKHKGLALLLLFALMMPGCSKKSPTEPENMISGRIRFINTSSYTIILNYMIQSRGAQSESATLNRRVEGNSGTAGRVELRNLLDGGFIFPGGDNVFVEFESAAINPDNPGQPLFTRTVTLTVNGTQNVQVKGQGGEYEIGGN